MKTQITKPARERASYTQEYKQEAFHYGARAAAAPPR